MQGSDPFQLFEVDHNPPTKVHIKVIQGYDITKGWAKDLVDTPDPYITLAIKTSPNSLQKTPAIDNDINPVWNKEFTFLVDPLLDNVLEISLMDANYIYDETLSTKYIPLNLEERNQQTVEFNETSKVDIEIWAEVDTDTKLRFSQNLCEEEKAFIDRRKKKIFTVMEELLGKDAPKSLDEVPTIGVLGSGGGFRAMTGLCGVFTALVDSRILDMATFVTGLSGSAWYISQLYSHPDWPSKSPGELKEELRNNIDSSPFWLLCPTSMYHYTARIIEKRIRGQPVSFTDFFGHLVGETLLKGRMDAKLTDQREILKTGEVPLPLYTCLHVKKHVSAMVFHEWMEFSPYEIGMAKYGTFMKSELFGGKLFMGSLVKQFPEPPLHFLQGIWGSAFCIQFKHLFQDKSKVDAIELMRQERDELEEELAAELDSQEDEDSETSDSELDEEMKYMRREQNGDRNEQKPPKQYKEQSFWSSMLEKVFDSNQFFRTIQGRAAMVHNFMRGLTLFKVYPFSPFNSLSGQEGEDTFENIFEMYPTTMKRLYVVDGGLTFNSPFPLLLRPQRGVDLLLSFDFSARPSDTTPPFKELLLAEKWARLNKIPFPKIDPTVVDREGLKECYVFDDPSEPACPTVLHFVLINITFREEMHPGVKRQTIEEEEFGDFDIFDDPENPYSTFNFTYSHKAFDRLTQLTEFNTKLNKDLIMEEIVKCVQKHKQFCVNRQFKLRDIRSRKIQNKDLVQSSER